MNQEQLEKHLVDFGNYLLNQMYFKIRKYNLKYVTVDDMHSDLTFCVHDADIKNFFDLISNDGNSTILFDMKTKYGWNDERSSTNCCKTPVDFESLKEFTMNCSSTEPFLEYGLKNVMSSTEPCKADQPNEVEVKKSSVIKTNLIGEWSFIDCPSCNQTVYPGVYCSSCGCKFKWRT